MKKKQTKIRFVFFLDFFVFRVLAKNSKIKKKLKTHARLGKKAQQKKRENDSLSRTYTTNGERRAGALREKKEEREEQREREIEIRRDLIKFKKKQKESKR